jgi:hypothetical protein
LARFSLVFQSELQASPAQAWSWAASVAGISAELRPFARMTVPRGLTSLVDVDVELGKPLVRSWFLLFGFLPVDRIDLTLVELHAGRGFVEQSPMLSMRLWRHERTIDALGAGSRLTDRLTFEPRVLAPVVRHFISALFRHRHRVLRSRLGVPAA